MHCHPEHLYWGGWSGRFSRAKHKNVWSRHAPEKADEQKYGDFYMFEADSEEEEWTDPVHNETFNSFMAPVWRFRRAMFNDFRARMDWCVKEFSEALEESSKTKKALLLVRNEQYAQYVVLSLN